MAEPNAREIGSVGIRVLPLTGKFKENLERKLERIEKTVRFTVNVTDVRLDRRQVRESVQAQLSSLRGLWVDVSARVNTSDLTRQVRESGVRFVSSDLIDDDFGDTLADRLSQALRDVDVSVNPDIDTEAVRRQIEELQAEFDSISGMLAEDILSVNDEAQLRQRLESISDKLDEISRNRETRIDANPFTAWASARLAWLARPRVVEIIPRVSTTAFVQAATALAALSGARLTFDYLERFSRWIGEIDKKLPRLTFGITGASLAFSALMASLSGVLGIGDGLAATLPSLLLLPGLLAGAVVSTVALFVALRHSKEELAELGPSYTNLGRIIRQAFWEDARPAIIEFSNSIMPQLERSFEKTSRALGGFTAELSRSFQREFANGRLEKMFDGLAEAWGILATGASAFAGAVTNLGLVAAQYMPRLAQWFVRLSIRFDNWLSKVATDGRLNQWIEEAIKSFYAIWDVMAATTGIFQGLWRAAERAGSGGLRGFADMLLDWERSVNSTRWQETLVAMFRGASEAMDAFSDAMDQLGRTLYNQRQDIEYFLAVSGRALGEFFEAVFASLALPEVGESLRKMVDGFAAGLKALEPAMDPLARIAGKVGELAGALAEGFGPVLAAAISAVEKPLANVLDALIEASPVLTGGLADFIRNAGPGLEEISGPLADIAGDLVTIVGLNLGQMGDELSDILIILSPIATALSEITGFIALLAGSGENLGITPEQLSQLDETEQSMVRIVSLTQAFQPVFQWFDQMNQGMHGVRAELDNFMQDLNKLPGQIWEALTNAYNSAATWLQQLPALFATAAIQAWNSFVGGLNTGWTAVATWLASVPGRIQQFFATLPFLLISSGISLLNGLAQGIAQGFENAKNTVLTGLTQLRGLFPFSPAKEGPFSGKGWVSFSGESVGYTFGESVASALRDAHGVISRELSSIRDEFDQTAGEGFEADMSVSRRAAQSATTSVMQGVLAPIAAGAAAVAGLGGNVVNFTVNNPVVRDGFEEAWLEAQGKGLGF